MAGLTTRSCPVPIIPFGGVKQSGLGRVGGQEDLEHTEAKYTATDW